MIGRFRGSVLDCLTIFLLLLLLIVVDCLLVVVVVVVAVSQKADLVRVDASADVGARLACPAWTGLRGDSRDS